MLARDVARMLESVVWGGGRVRQLLCYSLGTYSPPFLMRKMGGTRTHSLTHTYTVAVPSSTCGGGCGMPTEHWLPVNKESGWEMGGGRERRMMRKDAAAEEA